MNKKDKQIWFTEEQHRQIKVLSALNNISMRGFVMKAINAFTKKKQ